LLAARAKYIEQDKVPVADVPKLRATAPLKAYRLPTPFTKDDAKKAGDLSAMRKADESLRYERGRELGLYD
jgi:hypothetical protein